MSTICKTYKSNGFFAQKSYISKTFKGTISGYKGILHYDGYDYVDIPDEIMESLLSEPFFTRRMKMLGRPDGFIFYDKLGAEFSFTSELMYSNMRNSRISEPDLIFSWLVKTPTLVLDLLIAHVHSSQCSQRWLSEETNGHACTHSCGVQLIGHSSKLFYHSL